MSEEKDFCERNRIYAHQMCVVRSRLICIAYTINNSNNNNKNVNVIRICDNTTTVDESDRKYWKYTGAKHVSVRHTTEQFIEVVIKNIHVSACTKFSLSKLSVSFVVMRAECILVQTNYECAMHNNSFAFVLYTSNGGKLNTFPRLFY